MTSVTGLSSGNTYSFWVRCQDGAGNADTTDYAITFSIAAADTVPPVISNPLATGITTTSATITWATDELADSQVGYGLTSSLGQTSALDATRVTSHSVTINGLSAGTQYHFKAFSRDASGNLASTGDLTFTTSAGLQTVLRIAGEPSELSGTSNNSIITPASAPLGFSGTLKVNGSGSVAFVPATVGMGVSFLSCCSSTNNAYYQFTGASVGSVFNVDSGEISFSLKSTKSFAQRQASSGFRTVFGVEDSSGHFLFTFLVQAGSFSYRIASTGVGYYYIPAGQEDTVFGNGVTLRVRLVWDGTYQYLFLNDVLAQKNPYTKVPPVWSASSVFLLGGADYGYGVFNVSDDVVDEFIVKR